MKSLSQFESENSPIRESVIERPTRRVAIREQAGVFTVDFQDLVAHESKTIYNMDRPLAQALVGPFLEGVPYQFDPKEGIILEVKKNGKRSKLSAAASVLGRAGGEKGGPARARRLSPKRRKAIAAKGARARWKGGRKKED